MKKVKAINIYNEGVARTIKAQYYKNSLANFMRQDGLDATAVIEMET